MQFDKLLNKNLVVFLKDDNKHDVLNQMVSVAESAGVAGGSAAFRQMIFDRETIISTGIGGQTAVPHAKTAGIDKFFMVVGILAKGVDWDAIDGEKVRLVFLIGGPARRQNEYLGILSYIVKIVRNKTCKKALIDAKTAQEALDILSDTSIF